MIKSKVKPSTHERIDVLRNNFCEKMTSNGHVPGGFKDPGRVCLLPEQVEVCCHVLLLQGSYLKILPRFHANKSRSVIQN